MLAFPAFADEERAVLLMKWTSSVLIAFAHLAGLVHTVGLPFDH
jgi:hypothetical protein